MTYHLSVDEFQENFLDGLIPSQLKQLLEFSNADPELFYSGDFELEHCPLGTDGLSEQLAVFGRDWDGSVYALWCYADKLTADTPVVYLSENEACVVSENLHTFLSLLSLDLDQLGYRCSQLEFTGAEVENPRAMEFREWLSQRFRIKPPQDPKAIVEAGSSRHPDFSEWLESEGMGSWYRSRWGAQPALGGRLDANTIKSASIRGFLAALFLGFVWGLFASFARVRIEWLPALSVGFLVGNATRGTHERASVSVGLVGAFMALMGTIFAEAWTLWGIAVSQMNGLPHFFMHPYAIVALFQNNWSVMTGLGYLIGILEGYQFARRPPPARLPVAWIALAGAIVVVVLFALNIHQSKVVDVKLRPDGKKIAISQAGYSTSIKEHVWLYDIQRNQTTDLGMKDAGPLAWSPDGNSLANGLGKKFVVWSSRRVRLFSPKSAHRSFTRCLAYAPDGKTFATGGQDGRILLWDARRYQQTGELLHARSVSSVAFGNDSKLLYVGLRSGSIAVWDLATAKQLHFVDAHRARVTAICVQGDQVLTTGGVDASVKVWDTKALTLNAEFPLDFGWVMDLDIAPDEKTLAVAGGSFHGPAKVLLMDRRTGEIKRTLTAPTSTFTSVAFYQNGTRVMASSAAPISPFQFQHRLISQWDVQTGNDITTLSLQ